MTAADRGGLFPTSDVGALAWKFRSQQWGRWKYAVPKPTSPNAAPVGRPIDVVMKEVGGERGTLASILTSLDSMSAVNSVEAVAEAAGAKGVLTTSHEAFIGHILYQIQTDDYLLAMNKFTPGAISSFVENAQEDQRLFCHVFPGIPAFSQDPINRADFAIPPPQLRGVSRKDYFQLRFLASPWEHPDDHERYPPIRITMELDAATGDPHSPKLFALGAENTVDAMLPKFPADLRFVRREEVNLPVNAEKKVVWKREYRHEEEEEREKKEQKQNEGPQMTDEEVQVKGGVTGAEWINFLENSQLNPQSSFRLRTAQTMEVHVPHWIVLPPAGEDAAAAPEGEAPPAKPVTYFCMSLEWRREVRLKEKGVMMSRATVEGGTSGGRRIEVMLQADDGSVPLGNEMPAGVGFTAFADPRETGFTSFARKALSLVSSVEKFLGK